MLFAQSEKKGIYCEIVGDSILHVNKENIIHVHGIADAKGYVIMAVGFSISYLTENHYKVITKEYRSDSVTFNLLKKGGGVIEKINLPIEKPTASATE